MLLPFALLWHFNFEGRARIRAYIKFNEWNVPTLGLDLYGCFGSMYWIRAGWCVSGIQREKKKLTERERFINSHIKWYMIHLKASTAQKLSSTVTDWKTPVQFVFSSCPWKKILGEVFQVQKHVPSSLLLVYIQVTELRTLYILSVLMFVSVLL